MSGPSIQSNSGSGTPSAEMSSLQLEPMAPLEEDENIISVTTGQNASMFCSMCLNGGNLVTCSCGLTLCLDTCIPVPLDKVKGIFTCPVCWKQNRGFAPYRPFPSLQDPVMIPASASTRARFPMLTNESLCILVFRLRGFDPQICPARLVYSHIKSYFPGENTGLKLAFIEVEYNLRSSSSQTGLRKKLAKIAETLSEYKQFIVFISTHSTPDDGCLWSEPNPSPHSVTPSVLFSYLFPPCITAEIARDPAAMLFFITCGATFNILETRNEIVSFCKPLFWFTLAFVRDEFHPTTTHTFLLDFVRECYLHRKFAIFDSILLSHPNMGTGVDRILLALKNEEHPLFLYWSNPRHRPHGHPVSLSCRKCFAISSLNMKPLDDTRVGEKHTREDSAVGKSKKRIREGQDGSPQPSPSFTPRRGGDRDRLQQNICHYCHNPGCRAIFTYEPRPYAFAMSPSLLSESSPVGKALGYWIGQYEDENGCPVPGSNKKPSLQMPV
ncbi:hypothetical protein AN958_04585 [Leucoagaricus sp. SymC.cos]|nr:hypothetical protein AN958_04585 [Leucoagaricus sp. SymC.cos]